MKTIFLFTLFMVQNSFALTMQLEPLLGLQVERDGIEFTVFSGGCTSKEDFLIYTMESNPIQLELVRNHHDFCEAFIPGGHKIKFSWSELGLINESTFTIRNPIGLLHKPI